MAAESMKKTRLETTRELRKVGKGNSRRLRRLRRETAPLSVFLVRALTGPEDAE
jgi:hypothetical protein